MNEVTRTAKTIGLELKLLYVRSRPVRRTLRVLKFIAIILVGAGIRHIVQPVRAAEPPPVFGQAGKLGGGGVVATLNDRFIFFRRSGTDLCFAATQWGDYASLTYVPCEKIPPERLLEAKD